MALRQSAKVGAFDNIPTGKQHIGPLFSEAGKAFSRASSSDALYADRAAAQERWCSGGLIIIFGSTDCAGSFSLVYEARLSLGDR